MVAEFRGQKMQNSPQKRVLLPLISEFVTFFVGENGVQPSCLRRATILFDSPLGLHPASLCHSRLSPEKKSERRGGCDTGY